METERVLLSINKWAYSVALGSQWHGLISSSVGPELNLCSMQAIKGSVWWRFHASGFPCNVVRVIFYLFSEDELESSASIIFVEDYKLFGAGIKISAKLLG